VLSDRYLKSNTPCNNAHTTDLTYRICHTNPLQAWRLKIVTTTDVKIADEPIRAVNRLMLSSDCEPIMRPNRLIWDAQPQPESQRLP